MSYKRLGKYIQIVNNRNTDLEVERLLGVSIQKVLMPSIANTIGTNMKNYKIIEKHQFAYGPVTSRNGDKISIALLQDYDKAIVSQAYTVFEVIDKDQLDPEYLMMWFRRPEFDRYARFKSHGSARETFDWEEMCEVELPVPSIEKQREIVAEYHTVTNRIALNEKLNQKLEETAQALYKHWFVDFEFPNKEGKPYKSSGGKMVYNEELDKDIPEGWEVRMLGDIAEIKGGKRLPLGYKLHKIPNNHPYIKVADMSDDKFIIHLDNFEYVPSGAQKQIARYIVNKDDIILSIVGTIGITMIVDESLNNANLTENCVKISKFRIINNSYLYHFLESSLGKEQIKIRNVGAVQAKLPIYNIRSIPILCSNFGLMKTMERITEKIDTLLISNKMENQLLTELASVLLGRMVEKK